MTSMARSRRSFPMPHALEDVEERVTFFGHLGFKFVGPDTLVAAMRRGFSPPPFPSHLMARPSRHAWSDGLPPELLAIIVMQLNYLADRACFSFFLL
uniref:Uncharacterized protein n=1 Tax=Oryza nivara TaxID=4536 RepID=A0A0E0FQJ0_ORYNI